MKRQTENPQQVVDRFLRKMGEPVSEELSERATAEVLERLRAGDMDRFRAGAVSMPQARPSRLWMAFAAGVVAMLAGGLLQMTLVRFADSDIIARSSQGDLQIAGKTAAFSMSSRIAAGEVVKAGLSGGVIALLDGSQIELGPRTELSVIRVADGLRVRLTSGTVLVSAAKQRNGHLYVETKDCLISVVGTLFAVNAEETGSRVSVLEGEVHVQRGEVSQTLLAGQEVSTSPQLGPLSKAGKELANPERLVVLQPEPAPAPPQNPATSPGVTVRGVVKQGTGAGIPDVTVTLCPASATRVTIAPTVSDDKTPATNVVEGRIIKNKTFFFALWNTARCNATSVTTDSSGRFQFSNVAAGEYNVAVEREGYFGPAADPASGDGRGGVLRYFNAWTSKSEARPGRLPGDSKTFTVDAQQAQPEISLTLTRAGVITGRVRDTEGRLVVNAQVRVMTATAQSGDTLPAATATTNDLGEYRAYWIAPGDYRVVARGPDGRALAETWFPRGTTAAEGISVTVREGEEVPAIDIVLRPAQPGDPVQPDAAPVRWRIRQ